jgi:EmrB/QacA subfamily drug resistance transporter
VDVVAIVSGMTTVEVKYRWAGLVALLAAEAMNLLDATIVQVAGPAIHADLGGSVSDIQWFSTAYTLPFALLLITGGRLGDRAGRRRVFRIGVTAFGLASLACALAPSVGVLIGLRAVQGAAAAVIIPQTIGLIRAMFSGPELPRALGTIGPVMGLSAVLGPVLGGVLTHGTTWRSVFLVNVPLSVAVLAIAPWLVEDRAPRRPGLDPLGTLLVMAGTGLIVYPLIENPRSASSWLVIGLGVLVLVGFGAQQRVSRDPLVERSLFSGRAFPAALATSTVFFAVTTGVMLVVVLELQLGVGSGVLTAGLTLVPWSVGLALGSLTAGRVLVPRYGHRVLYAGLTVLLLGVLGAIAVYHSASPTAYPTGLLVPLGIAGLGMGLFTTPFFTTALKPLRPQEIGSASGLLNAVQQLGATLGVAAFGSIYLAGNSLDAAELACWVAAGSLVLTALTAPGRSSAPTEP